MTAALAELRQPTQYHAGLSVLQRISAALRAVDCGECRYRDPIRSLPHAYHVMHLHRGHDCARLEMAAHYARGTAR
ncbi:hypothetical protein [Nocardia carnea]|uniref:hypothetical protein n=1 Tax=Nocardia carnea TaxID=37328 RepID=UPI002457E1EA|nr:hypothetical protein [Nocardia carnea]